MSTNKTGFTLHKIGQDSTIRKAVAQIAADREWSIEHHFTSETFVETVHQDLRGCVVVDLDTPGIRGIDFQRELVARCSSLPVIFIAGSGDIEGILALMRFGAWDVLTKPLVSEMFVNRVEAALIFDQKLSTKRNAKRNYAKSLYQLTPRERQVMELVVQGLANKQTAAALSMSERTVEVHRARVMAKMGAVSLAELVGGHVNHHDDIVSASN